MFVLPWKICVETVSDNKNYRLPTHFSMVKSDIVSKWSELYPLIGDEAKTYDPDLTDVKIINGHNFIVKQEAESCTVLVQQFPGYFSTDDT